MKKDRNMRNRFFFGVVVVVVVFFLFFVFFKGVGRAQTLRGAQLQRAVIVGTNSVAVSVQAKNKIVGYVVDNAVDDYKMLEANVDPVGNSDHGSAVNGNGIGGEVMTDEIADKQVVSKMSAANITIALVNHLVEDEVVNTGNLVELG
jgi:hypothetical protein